MRITVVNPNSTASMTQMIGEAARSVAAAGTKICTVTSPSGPASVESYFDECCAAAGILESVMEIERTNSADAVIIACYGDPGLYAAREIATRPVVGIAQASMYMAALVAARFSIVTDLGRGINSLSELVRRYGMAEYCASIRASEVPVLAFEADRGQSMAALKEQSRLAMEIDRAEAICLGCAGLVTFTQELEQTLGIPVFDGVTAAVKMAEGLVSMKKNISKICTFETPEPKMGSGYAGQLMNCLKLLRK